MSLKRRKQNWRWKVLYFFFQIHNFIVKKNISLLFNFKFQYFDKSSNKLWHIVFSFLFLEESVGRQQQNTMGQYIE